MCCFGTLALPFHFLSSMLELQWLFAGRMRVEWLWVNGFSPYEQAHDPAFVDTRRKSYWNMKHQSSLCRCPILAEVKRQCECPEECITEFVWLNRMLVPIIQNAICHMNHVSCIYVSCYSYVELKWEINTMPLFDQALNPAHPSLLIFCCWPWGSFGSWLASCDPGTACSSYLAGVGPVV